MSNLLQDLTYYVARLGAELKELEDFRTKTENKIALAVLRGRIRQTSYILSDLKTIYKKEEKRQSKKGNVNIASRKKSKIQPKLSRQLLDKFKYL